MNRRRQIVNHQQPRIHQTWLTVVIGRRLLSVEALIHEFKSVAHRFPQEICFHFEGSGPGRFFCESDGASIGLSMDPLIECDMQEYGVQVIKSMSDDAGFAGLINKTLTSATWVKSSVQDRVLGVGFSFDSQKSLFVLNLGDELFICSSIPSEVVVSERLHFIAVGG